MKKTLFLLLLLPFVCGISVVGQNDSIPPRIKEMAMQKTDHQIDSVYSVVPPYIDAIRNDFRALRSHMDTINMESIIRQEEYEKAAVERDKAVQDWLIAIHQNTQLRKENKEQERKIDFAKSAPHYFMLFIVVLAASYFGSGMNNYFSKRRKYA